ncbi:MAG: hypothetical protein CL708_05695 [Chloroflexi bacterium]|nr:hypothetical protein [Chloroflexota bacterium]
MNNFKSIKTKINLINSYYLTLVFLSLVSFYLITNKTINIYKYESADNQFLIYNFILILVNFVFICFLIFVLFQDKINKIKIAFLISTIAITIIGFEIFLNIPNKTSLDELKSTRIEKAKEQKVDFDTRDMTDVINSLDYMVYPNFKPGLLLFEDAYINGIKSNEKNKIFPLANMSNIKSILTNENGYFPIVETDKFGFTNEAKYHNSKKTDILLVGGSFIEGLSVKQEENLSSNLNKAGYKTISLGKAGHGPLLGMASIREYGSFFKPPIVIWGFSSNDNMKLYYELKSDLLQKYLTDRNFSQNLITKQNEIDEAIRGYINSKSIGENTDLDFQIIKNESDISVFISKILKIIKLTELRDIVFNKLMNTATNEEISLEQILKIANDEIKKWGGELYIVYTPGLNEVKTNYTPGLSEIKKNNTKNIDKIYTLSSNLNINTVNFYQSIIKMNNYKSIYPFGQEGHYNSDGYKMLSEILIQSVEANNE